MSTILNCFFLLHVNLRKNMCACVFLYGQDCYENKNTPIFFAFQKLWDGGWLNFFPIKNQTFFNEFSKNSLKFF